MDNALCAKYGLCEKACPVLHGQEMEKDPCRKAMSVSSRDEDLLFSSSSGGLFTLLARAFFEDGDCVFDTALSNDFKKAALTMVMDLDAQKKQCKSILE